jgi:sialate O-acetylesterase
MNVSCAKSLVLGLLLMASAVVSAQPPLKLPAILGDHAVLQQNADVKLWGWAPCTWPLKISCSWSPADTVSVMPGRDCSWSAVVKTPKAGGPYTITFISAKQKKVIGDILTGEVWLCSGQSNMEFSFNWGILDGHNEVAEASDNAIRFFRISHSYNNFPQTECDGQWVVASPQSVADMSVAGYIFGKRIHEYTKAPVGLIASYWGGTSVQVWIPEEILDRDNGLKSKAGRLKPVSWSPVEPSVIYNAMIYPLVPFKIAGAIWYQGEANTEYPQDYGALFKALISGWREAFCDDFPFYFAQIAPWSGYAGLSAALLREQQESALSMFKTGMINVSDLVNDVKDIHPKLKVTVGNRFAGLALKECYGATDINPYFPRFASLELHGGNAVVKVASAGKLICRDHEIAGFQIAGNDRKFYPAKAKPDRNGLIVLHSDLVPEPVAVRYCFTNDAIPNLFDVNGLPLLPFRTDPW